MVNNLFSPESYLTPKAGVFDVNGEKAVRSIEPICSGELVAVFGGVLISTSELMELSDTDRQMTMQVDDEVFSFSNIINNSDYINHSCEPNSGFIDSFSLVSMRDIDQDEDLTFDYAMTDSTSFDEFVCLCGSVECRGKVTGDDWRLTSLQEKYANWFSPYLKLRLGI